MNRPLFGELHPEVVANLSNLGLVARDRPTFAPHHSANDDTGLVMNALAAAGHSTILGELDLTESVAAMAGEAARVNAGDLSGVETVLVARRQRR